MPKCERCSLVFFLFVRIRRSGVTVVRHKTVRVRRIANVRPAPLYVRVRAYAPRSRRSTRPSLLNRNRPRDPVPLRSSPTRFSPPSSNVVRASRDGRERVTRSGESWRARYFSARDRMRPIVAPCGDNGSLAVPPARPPFLPSAPAFLRPYVNPSRSRSRATRRNRGPT